MHLQGAYAQKYPGVLSNVCSAPHATEDATLHQGSSSAASHDPHMLPWLHTQARPAHTTSIASVNIIK